MGIPPIRFLFRRQLDQFCPTRDDFDAAIDVRVGKSAGNRTEVGRFPSESWPLPCDGTLVNRQQAEAGGRLSFLQNRQDWVAAWDGTAREVKDNERK